MHATNVGFRERLKLHASVATLNKEFIEVAIRRNMFSEHTFKPMKTIPLTVNLGTWCWNGECQTTDTLEA